MGVQQLAQLMRQLGLEPTEEEILDVLWLAPLIRPAGPLLSRAGEEPGDLAAPPPAAIAVAEPYDEPPRPERPRSAESAPPGSAGPPRETRLAPSLHLMGPAGAGDRPAAALRVPAVAALGDQLRLSRALRPLKRKRPSRHLLDVDEEATAYQIAEQRLWVPALRPAPVRWLELAVVVDGYESMLIWRQLVSEFRGVLERLGAFSDIRFWILDQFDGHPARPGVRREGAGSPLRSAGELIDPAGRRAVLVISDCLGPLWRSGAAQRQLAEWGRSQPVAIVQPLPQRLWAYSHVRTAPVRLRAWRPGAPNAQLSSDIRPQAPGPAADLVPVPVLELGADWFASWSRLISATGTSGVYSMAMFASPDGLPDAGLVPVNGQAVNPRALLQRFRATVSPEAAQLAVYLTAVPISLPVIRLVQRTMLPVSQFTQVAEVFLGGLLRRQDQDAATDPDLIQYEFVSDGVRELLQRQLRRTDGMRLLLAVADYMDVRFGQARDFRALLAGHGVKGDYLIGPDSRPFAVVAERVLRLLGGQYLAPAEALSVALDVSGPVMVSGTSSVAAPLDSSRTESGTAGIRPVQRSKQRPLVCPYCYHAFTGRDILFRCTGRARVGQVPCKPERDEVLETRMGQATTLLPPVFRPDKSADDAVCPQCHQATRIQVCPHCHSRLPATFRSVEGRLIALAGPSLAGKTAFMTVLIHELRHRTGEILQASTTGADERSHERYVRDYESPLYRRSLLFPRTTTAGEDYIQPLVFRFTMDQPGLFRQRPKELLLSFADGAGEDLVSPDKVELMTRYLAAADGVITFVDPLQLPEVRNILGRTTTLPPLLEPDQISAFRRITDLLAAGDGDAMIGKPISIVVTKLDAVESLLPPDSILRAPATISPFFGQGESMAIQGQIEGMLSAWGASSLVDCVRQRYSSSRFFGVSSLGFPPVSSNRVAPQGVQPYRVAEPFMYLLNQFSFLSAQ